MSSKCENSVIVDLGQAISVASSLFLAQLAAQESEEKIYFLMRKKFSNYADHFPQLHFLYIEEKEFLPIIEKACTVVDYTLPGDGMSLIADKAQNLKRMHIKDFELSALNLLTIKAEFLQHNLGLPQLLKLVPTMDKESAVLTYTAATAAYLNMLGVPTIELCYKFKKPGSFLPGSLVIKGESFSLLHREDLDLIFDFYKSNRIEDLFANKSILQVEWDLMYFKNNFLAGTVTQKNYPVSDTEHLMDLFFRGFMTIQSTFSMDKLLTVAQRIDPIDLDGTLDFMKKVVKRCLEDLEYECFPLTESYWNFIKPYADCTSRRGLATLHRSLTQAAQGLEMFEKIMRRQRKALSMH